MDTEDPRRAWAPYRFDPRIHFAVNCASVGCPMLREEAFVADRLDAQLEQQAQRFMSDRTRNRWNPQRQRLEVSKIFDWFGEDFRLGHRGITSLPAFLARYADVLADHRGQPEPFWATRRFTGDCNCGCCPWLSRPPTEGIPWTGSSGWLR